MRIPLINRLKRRSQKGVALLQDEVMDIVYAIAPKAVLHGGTAIWRCYAGQRFSEDLDFYLKAGIDFEQKLKSELESRGLQLLKYKKTENAVYSKISGGNTEVRLELALRNVKNCVVESYEKVDGGSMDIFTLSAEDLILEKINAYANRRLIRDFYDVYFLCRKIAGSDRVRKNLDELFENLPKPADEKNLRTIVYTGAVPSFEQMINALQRRSG